jgi:hypothetical protein
VTTPPTDVTATRWTAETEALVVHCLRLEPDEPDGLEEFFPGEDYDDARRILTALADAGLLLPPDGDAREEYGTLDPRYGLIHRTGRRLPDTTHIRTHVSWLADGPNDNWPVYLGPWREVPRD